MKLIEVRVDSDSRLRVCPHIVIDAQRASERSQPDAVEILQLLCRPCRRRYEIAVHSGGDVNGYAVGAETFQV